MSEKHEESGACSDKVKRIKCEIDALCREIDDTIDDANKAKDEAMQLRNQLVETQGDLATAKESEAKARTEVEAVRALLRDQINETERLNSDNKILQARIDGALAFLLQQPQPYSS